MNEAGARVGQSDGASGGFSALRSLLSALPLPRFRKRQVATANSGKQVHVWPPRSSSPAPQEPKATPMVLNREARVSLWYGSVF